LASASWDKTVKLWNAADGTLLRTLAGHTSYVISVNFSPDGRTLASASSDKTVKLWNAADGTLLRTLAGHPDSVFSVSFSPDSRILASAGRDKTVKLWNAANGELLRILAGRTDSAFSISFSPDGRTLASASSDATVVLYRIENRQPLKIIKQAVLASLPDKQWMAWQPGKLFYNSSLRPGEKEYAAVRFNNRTYDIYPLEYYREELKRKNWIDYVNRPQPDIQPKPIRK